MSDVLSEELSIEDRVELDKMATYIQRRVERPAESARDSYAEVYGEVVFDDCAGGFECELECKCPWRRGEP